MNSELVNKPSLQMSRI